jgi:hypothetical protein
MTKATRISITLAATIAGLAIYNLSFAEDNNVCSNTPEGCKSGTIIVVKDDKQIAMYCDFSKSIVNGSGAYICVKK